MEIGPRRGKVSRGGNRERTCQERNCAFYALSRTVLGHANASLPRERLAAEILGSLLALGGCDAIEVWFREPEGFLRATGTPGSDLPPRMSHVSLAARGSGPTPSPERDRLLCEHLGARLPPGSDGSEPSGPMSLVPLEGLPFGPPGDAPVASLLFVPLVGEGEDFGFVVLESQRPVAFVAEDRAFYEVVAETIVASLTNQRAHAALRERVKELTCLYSVARLSEKPELSLPDLLQGIVRLLPPAWQYPEITQARIVLDRRSFETPGFAPGSERQRADIAVAGQVRGFVEVHYAERRPTLDEGPFLHEERNLIDALAREIAGILARRQAQEEKARLEEQLRHADRLATIGQLAAGVAHELNEPLGAILGFAQLSQAEGNLPPRVAGDLAKIVQACLHAREVVRNLRLFARQMPPNLAPVNLNDVVRDNLYFFSARCVKDGVELSQDLAPDLPPIVADAGQLNQVLLNLVVNALQAMPGGGRLTISTRREGDDVLLAVKDTGTGMSEDVLRQVFVPFFTTKEVDQGTGLGLAVVHGIVTSHGGTIVAESQPGIGSVFTVRLPARGRGTGPWQQEERK
jgi:signal transduction histidine kinase